MDGRNLISKVNPQSIFYRALALLVRAALLVALAGGGWIVYQRLPASDSLGSTNAARQTVVQIILRRSPDIEAAALDIPIELSPVDVLAVKHEFFVEPRAGQRFDEFLQERMLQERMKGRSTIKTKLDAEGHASIMMAPGNWWVNAVLPADADLEWRLPVTVSGDKQTVELTLQNAYTRSKSF